MMGYPGGYAPPVAGSPGPVVHAPGGYTPLPPGADPQAMPPPAAPASGGGGALAVLLVAQAFLVLGFFVLSIVITWIRADRGVAPSIHPVPPSWSVPLPTSVAPPSGEWIAIVSETKGLPGVIRDQPSMQATKTGTVPPGTEVDVLDTWEAGRRWYRIRTRGRLPALVGWMHIDILRPK